MKRLLPIFLLIACGTPAPIVDAGRPDAIFDAPFHDAAPTLATRRPHTPAPLTRLNQIIVFRDGSESVYGANHYSYELSKACSDTGLLLCGAARRN